MAKGSRRPAPPGGGAPERRGPKGTRGARFTRRMYTFTFTVAPGSHGGSYGPRQILRRRFEMDLMHKLVPEEEVYQMLLLFVLGVGVGAVAGVIRYFKAEGRKA